MKCLVCSKDFKSISNTHLRSHDLTIAQYKEKFPEAEVKSEVQKEACQKNGLNSKGFSRDPEQVRRNVEKCRKTKDAKRLLQYPWPTERQQQIILGGMLGDSYLHYYAKNPGNGYLEVYHGPEQLDYLNWKIKELESLGSKYHEWTRYWEEYQREYTRYWMTTAAHPYWKQIREMFYIDRKKIVTQQILDELQPLALAVWYMDDGFTFKKSYTANWCTQSFSIEENKMIVNYLKKKWNIDSKLAFHKEQAHLILNKEGRENLFKIIKPYIIKSMEYKLGVSNV